MEGPGADVCEGMRRLVRTGWESVQAQALGASGMRCSTGYLGYFFFGCVLRQQALEVLSRRPSHLMELD